ncbi:hypothetical protein SBV1_1220049 [Verrucomicrobia bacterium]|nr:hypothetical protein SBV1_1220049 [Verrucomicrobiota bacterium]
MPLDMDLRWFFRRDLEALDGLDYVKRDEVIHNEPSLDSLSTDASARQPGASLPFSCC